MSILNDFKKLLFGAKSVAKSAADKTVEAGKEAGQEWMDKSGDLLDKATGKVEQIGAVVMDKAEDLGQKIWTETEDFVAKARQYAETVTNGPKEVVDERSAPLTDVPPVSATPIVPEPPATPATPNVAEQIGEKVGEVAVNVGEKVEGVAEQVGSKVLDAAENIGAKALDVSADLSEKLKGVSENIGETVIEKSGELYDKAKSFGENLLGKADDLVEKAQRAAEAEANLDETTAKAQQLNDLLNTKVEESTPKGGPIDTKEGLLGKHDSFFDRAQRFADGDYHNEGGRETRLFTNPDDASKNKKGGKAAGFEDLDGDGNELIDDAIVEE